MFPCKWNHASFEKKVSCRSISSSMIHCRNQLQQWTLLVGSCSCKAWITTDLYGLSCSNCVAFLALYCDTPVTLSTRRLFFCFLFIKSPVNRSLFTKLWIVCLLGTLSSQKFLSAITSRIVFDISMSYRNTCCSEVSRTMIEHSIH
jgi:hypothetical protein